TWQSLPGCIRPLQVALLPSLGDCGTSAHYCQPSCCSAAKHHEASSSFRKSIAGLASPWRLPDGLQPVVDPDLQPFAASYRVHDSVPPEPIYLLVLGSKADFVNKHSTFLFQPQQHQPVRILMVAAGKHDVGVIGGDGERAIYAVVPQPDAIALDPDNGKVGVR